MTEDAVMRAIQEARGKLSDRAIDAIAKGDWRKAKRACSVAIASEKLDHTVFSLFEIAYGPNVTLTTTEHKRERKHTPLIYASEDNGYCPR